MITYTATATTKTIVATDINSENDPAGIFYGSLIDTLRGYCNQQIKVTFDRVYLDDAEHTTKDEGYLTEIGTFYNDEFSEYISEGITYKTSKGTDMQLEIGNSDILRVIKDESGIAIVFEHTWNKCTVKRTFKYNPSFGEWCERLWKILTLDLL